MALWFGLLSIAISNCKSSHTYISLILNHRALLVVLVLLRLWVLWERDRLLMAWTGTIFVATQITTITAVAFASVHIRGERALPAPSFKLTFDIAENLVYEPFTMICTLKRKTQLAPLWSPGVCFYPGHVACRLLN